MTSDDSVYRNPAGASPGLEPGDGRSLEDAVEGRFELDVLDTLREGWALVDGSKAVILGGFAVLLGVNLLGDIANFLLGGGDPEEVTLLGALASLAAAAVQLVLQAGLYLYAIKRAAGDASASFDDLFTCFSRAGTILGVGVLSWLLIALGLLLLVLPGLYLVIAYQMAVPLVAARGLGVWDALETSRQAITHCWLRFAGVLLAAGLATAVGSVLTLGIGAIWLLPFLTLTLGVAYVRIFGHAASPA